VGARGTGVRVHILRYRERAGLVVTTVDRWRRYQQLDLVYCVTYPAAQY
jgi:hypothetical protein